MRVKCLLFLTVFIVMSVGSVACMEDPFESFIKQGWLQRARKLVDKEDFNPNMTGTTGEPLIFLVVEKGYLGLASDIIGKSTFDPHIKNKNGKNIFSVVVEKGWTGVASKIAEHKNFNAANSSATNSFDCGAACEEAYQRGYRAGAHDVRDKVMPIIVQEFTKAAENIKNNI